MTKITNETTLEGIEIVNWVNDDGSGGSMLKSTYDEQQAAQAMPQLMPEVVEIIPEETQIILEEAQILPEEVQVDPVIPEA
jgi:hypothetical protein